MKIKKHVLSCDGILVGVEGVLKGVGWKCEKDKKGGYATAFMSLEGFIGGCIEGVQVL